LQILYFPVMIVGFSFLYFFFGFCGNVISFCRMDYIVFPKIKYTITTKYMTLD